MQITPIPYTLRFRRPAQTSRGALLERQVIFLRSEEYDQPGVTGWGECGPVPGLSVDDREDFAALVSRVCQAIAEGHSPDLSTLPSLAFGLETALADLAAGGSQRLYDTPFSHGQATLPIHGLIWMDNPEGILRQAEEKVGQGCRVLKLKIGALPWAEELAVLAKLRRRYPPERVSLRLDANGAFSAADAADRLRALAPFEIELLEQPIRPGQRQAMAELCCVSPVPIALDEELIGVPPAERASLLEVLRPQHIVLKPTLLGGLAACEAWIAEAGKLGIQWWINSSLESHVGLNAIAQWTSHLDPDRVHGLGTGQLYENDIVSRLRHVGCGLVLESGAMWGLDAVAKGTGGAGAQPGLISS